MGGVCRLFWGWGARNQCQPSEDGRLDVIALACQAAGGARDPNGRRGHPAEVAIFYKTDRCLIRATLMLEAQRHRAVKFEDQTLNA